jgi:hypothetical protein
MTISSLSRDEGKASSRSLTFPHPQPLLGHSLRYPAAA